MSPRQPSMTGANLRQLSRRPSGPPSQIRFGLTGSGAIAATSSGSLFLRQVCPPSRLTPAATTSIRITTMLADISFTCVTGRRSSTASPRSRSPAAGGCTRSCSAATRFVLEEIAASFTVDEVLSLTGMSVTVADNVKVMQESWI
jgi:hypothetical protein